MSYSNKKGIDIIGGFKPHSAQPIDTRTKVATVAERDELITANVVYAGLQVWVDEEAKTYEWNGTEWVATVTGTAYIHPETHPATMIEEDESHRFVTDAEKEVWDAKASTDIATPEKDGLQSAADKEAFNEMKEGFADKVDISRTINGHGLDTDVELTADDVGAIPITQKGTANGVAELDATGKVPSSQLPGFVDDVVDIFAVEGKFYLAVNGVAVPVESTTEVVPEDSKIYIDVETNKEYRWSGTTYVRVNEGVALGETANTAFRGDHGKVAYDHSQEDHAPADAQKNVQPDWLQDDETADDYVKNKPKSFPAKGGDADTIGGHTVKTDVPENAVFTDTTYDIFDDKTDGLVPKTGEITEGKLRFLTDTGIWKSFGLEVSKVIIEGEESQSNDLYIKLLDEEGNDITKTMFPTVSATGYGLMTPEMLVKLNSIDEGATAYTHPETHPATMIEEDEAHKFVTSAEKEAWNAKATKDVATSENAGLMSAKDKEKLDSIDANATKYEHPETHPATMIEEDETHQFVKAEDKDNWNAKQNIYVGVIGNAPKRAVIHSLFLQVIGGATYEESEDKKQAEYQVFYDSKNQVGVKADEHGNLTWYNTTTGEKKDLLDWGYVNNATNEADLCVSDNGVDWYYAYPEKHTDGIFTATVDSGSVLKNPLLSPMLSTFVGSNSNDGSGILVYKEDPEGTYRTYDADGNVSPPKTFTNIITLTNGDESQEFSTAEGKDIIKYTTTNGTTIYSEYNKAASTVTEFQDGTVKGYNVALLNGSGTKSFTTTATNTSNLSSILSNYTVAASYNYYNSKSGLGYKNSAWYDLATGTAKSNSVIDWPLVNYDPSIGDFDANASNLIVATNSSYPIYLKPTTGNYVPVGANSLRDPKTIISLWTWKDTNYNYVGIWPGDNNPAAYRTFTSDYVKDYQIKTVKNISEAKYFTQAMRFMGWDGDTNVTAYHYTGTASAQFIVLSTHNSSTGARTYEVAKKIAVSGSNVDVTNMSNGTMRHTCMGAV